MGRLSIIFLKMADNTRTKAIPRRQRFAEAALKIHIRLPTFLEVNFEYFRLLISRVIAGWGAFKNYVDHFLPDFDHLPTYG